jgi:hypothetical protein
VSQSWIRKGAPDAGNVLKPARCKPSAQSKLFFLLLSLRHLFFSILNTGISQWRKAAAGAFGRARAGAGALSDAKGDEEDAMEYSEYRKYFSFLH